MAKFDQLSEQIDFLVTLQQDALDECLQEFGSLMTFLEKYCADHNSDESLIESLDMIRDVLSQNYQRMLDEYEADLEYLRGQKRMVDASKNVQDEAKREEIQKLILEDAGELEDTEKFKKKVEQESAQARNDFLNTVADIKEAVEDGSIDELMALCEEAKLQDSEERLSEKENADEAVDFSNQKKINELLKIMSEPFSVDVKDEEEKGKK